MNNLLFENTSTKTLSLDLGTSSIGWAIVENRQVRPKNYFTKNIVKRHEDPLLKNLQTLRSIKQLPVDWNGKGSVTFSEALIQKVFTIVRELQFQPDIFPTGRNSIQLEFEIGDDYLEFEIFEDKIIGLIQFNGKDEEREILEEEIFKLTEDFHAATVPV
ncbi:MAG: hypothetical protein ACXIUD_09485 [Mongoliitalea sp.]